MYRLKKTVTIAPAYILFVALGLVLLAAAPASAQNCTPTADRHAYHLFTEIWGSRTHREPIVDTGWVFTLLKAKYGWHIRLYDQAGVDLTQITPPFRFGVNHRDIMGWHFRNADNSAPNDGSINAPQTKRTFIFSRSLEGTGGFRPPDEPQATEPHPDDGLGWLNIVDYGLADLEKNQKARLVYMKFSACLTWPKSQEEIAQEADFNSSTYLPEEIERMAACGLKAPYLLTAYVKPRLLEGDIDGDDAIDLFAPIIHQADGKRGIAICRAGTWLDILGLEGRIGPRLEPGYFDQIENWSVVPAAHLPKTGEEGEPPKLEGDALMLERIEKSRYFIYWDGTGYQSYLEYEYVEP